ncbi:Histone-lysine N-methyltransferase SUVR4, partial [Mucuna pruriens]
MTLLYDKSFEFPEDTTNYLQDYGIDFDDHEHPIKAFECCCGSAFCRDKQQKVFTPSAPSKKDTRKPANKSPSKEKTKKSRATTDKARQKLTFGHVTSPSLDANKRKPSGVLAGEGTAKKGKAVIDLDVAFVSEQAQAFVDSVGTSSNDMVSFRAPTPLESLWANGLDPWSVLPPSFMRSYDESFLTSQDFTKTYDMLGTYLLRSMAAMTAWRDSLKGANPTILQKLKVENQQLQTDLDRFKGIQEELQTSLTASQATIDSKTVKVATSKEELLKLKEECYRMKKDLDAAALARSALEETRSLDQKKLLKLQEELDVATLEKTMLEQKLKGSEEQHAELKQTLSNAREEKKELSEQISTLEDALLEGYQAGFDNALSQVALLSSDLDLSSCDSDKIVKDGKLVVPID